jgi:hypothetical protein
MLFFLTSMPTKGLIQQILRERQFFLTYARKGLIQLISQGTRSQSIISSLGGREQRPNWQAPTELADWEDVFFWKLSSYLFSYE